MQPAKIGRFEIMRELGRGAMGRVLLAHDPEIDRRVAIKVVQAFSGLTDADHAEARQRFLREARAAGKLLHPGIVALFDVGEADGALYLAMEYVEGETLDHFCRAGSLLSVDQVVEMIAGAADALAYAHRAGVVHRDIKPANLMRTGAAAVKIMDFGLARGAEAGLTQDGALLGTPSYMAPEQIRGQAVDGRSDLFSLALVLYELLTGHRAFPGDTVSAILYRIVNEPARDPTEVGDERVPPALRDFLSRALSKHPDQRYRDGAEFGAALRGSQPGSTPPATQTAKMQPAREVPIAERELPRTSRAQPERSSALPFVIGILLTFALALGAAWTFRERLGWLTPAPPIEFEATLRVEPEQAEVRLDGELLADAQRTIRFAGERPGPLLSAELGCRREEHRLGPADAGSEVALVLDPTTLTQVVDGVPEGATLRLNDEVVGRAPVELTLDLCRENRLVVSAPGFREESATIPGGVSPLEARRLLAAIAPAPIPLGTLEIPSGEIPLVLWIDDERIAAGRATLELPEGEHRLRWSNAEYWIDGSTTVRVVGGETVRPALELPPLTTLVVFAYPPNCKVDLRRPGGSWTYIEDVPVRKRIAAGRYELRVTLKPTGEARTQEIELTGGSNPDVRISFGS